MPWSWLTMRRSVSGQRDIAQTAAGKREGKRAPTKPCSQLGVTQALTHLPLPQTPELPPPGTDGD